MDGRIGKREGSDDVRRTTLRLRAPAFVDIDGGERPRDPARDESKAEVTASLMSETDFGELPQTFA